jgi:hypothetical protein
MSPFLIQSVVTQLRGFPLDITTKRDQTWVKVCLALSEHSGSNSMMLNAQSFSRGDQPIKLPPLTRTILNNLRVAYLDNLKVDYSDIAGSQGGEYEVGRSLGCSAAQSRISLLTL